MKTRTAIVVSHPIQHFCPLYRALEEDGRLHVRVFFGSTAGAHPYFDKDFSRTVRWQDDLVEGFEHEFLPGADSVTDLSRSIQNAALERRLDAFDPAAVVGYGFFHAISRDAYRWARRRRRRALSIADSELRSQRGLALRLRKRLTVPFMLRQVDAFLTVGDSNEAYYRFYGANRDKLFRSPFPLDVRSLDSVLADRGRHRARVRCAVGAGPDDCVLLVVGKLTKRKCCDHAIRAIGWALAKRGGERLRLVLAGDGPERAVLKALADRVAPDRVCFAGFVEVGDLPAYYAAADVLVHPSAQDPHPLVLSEGIYCGLPCIVSDRVGSVGSTDDIRPGENGLEYPFRDIERLGQHMLDLASDSTRRAALGRRSLKIGAERTLAISVEGFVRGVNAGS